MPPKISAPLSPTWVAGLILGALALVGGATLFFFNPAKYGFYPICAFHQLTGLNCPGCGATRAAYALVHGQLATAVRDNALLVLALAGWMIRAVWVIFRSGGRVIASEFFPAKLLWPLLVVALVFTVLRNLPAFAFLSP